MTPEELYFNFYGAVLFYLNTINNVKYDIYLSNVCLFTYGENYEITIDQWLLDTNTIPEPSINDLLAFNLNDVTTFYDNKYVIIETIKNQQAFYKLSQSQQDDLIMTNDSEGFIFFNTNAKKLMRYDIVNGWVGLW
jgi:hypothetical protein